uniref:AP_endonuc_2 domain-containing protein n=1 Tax=Elaeophora elaphi TaxID=1147741 RepID=A0A158Q921_9BILA
MEMKLAMVSADTMEGLGSSRVHSKVVLSNSSLNAVEIVRTSFTDVPQETSKEGDDQKREMFGRKSTRVKSKKTANLAKEKMKESLGNNGGTRTVRKRTKAIDSTGETKRSVIDAKDASVSLGMALTTVWLNSVNNFAARKRKCSAEVIFKGDDLPKYPIAQKVIKAAAGSRKMLGAHVSVAGGLEQGFYNAISIGCRSFAFFVRNQRSWNSLPMKDGVVQVFRETSRKLKFPMDQIVVHGSYLINAGSCDFEILERARACMLDECKRCEQLGIIYYNIHPGSTAGKCTREECIKTIAATLNYVIDHTEYITILIETMAGQGNTIGGKFEELQQIISLVKNKKRVGVCLDTCHIFAAGYDIRSEDQYKEALAEFDNCVGLQHLRAFHINDSMGKQKTEEQIQICKLYVYGKSEAVNLGDLGSRLDRHANIGKGKLKLAAFRHLMADPRFDGLPMILETPEGDYAEEMIRLYQSLNSKPPKEHKRDIRSFFSHI